MYHFEPPVFDTVRHDKAIQCGAASKALSAFRLTFHGGRCADESATALADHKNPSRRMAYIDHGWRVQESGGPGIVQHVHHKVDDRRLDGLAGLFEKLSVFISPA